MRIFYKKKNNLYDIEYNWKWIIIIYKIYILDSVIENLEIEKLQENINNCTKNLNAEFKFKESYSNDLHEKENTEDECKKNIVSENKFQWLTDLDNRKSALPNFWLILNVENDYVNVYFHCR